MKRKLNNDIDARIGLMLRDKDAIQVPKDPWFVRKTVNRLPAKRERLVGVPEIVALVCLIVAAATVVLIEIRRLLSLDDPALFDPTMMITALGLTLAATLYIVLPVLKRCWP